MTVPDGRGLGVAIASGTGAGAIVKPKVLEAVVGVAAQESATCTVGVNAPFTVGVPESRPFKARDVPEGIAPAVSVHV